MSLGPNTAFLLVPTAHLEDHVRTPTARLEHLQRLRIALTAAWAVVLGVSAVLLASSPFDTLFALVLCAAVAFSGISLVLAVISIVRIRSELAGRRYEARFPRQEQ